MITYKITNLTNLIGKRELKYNSVLEIKYVDSMTVKTISMRPGETIYLTIPSLPVSVHRLRVNKLISVVEISENELNKFLEGSKPYIPKREVINEPEKKVDNPVKKKNDNKKTHEYQKKHYDETSNNE